MSKTDMTGRVCVVTGGNSGIGKWTVIGLAKLGARVALVSRNAEKGAAALEEAKAESGSDAIDLVIGDLGSFASVRLLAADLLERYEQINVLVNNAGLWMTERTLTDDGLETTFAVNHLAPFLLTHLLLDRLEASAPARVVNVASHGHTYANLDLEDLQAEKSYGKIEAYCNSKLCNVLFTRELARQLDGTGVTTYSLHPGVVRTNLGGNSSGIIKFGFKVGSWFFMTPEKGARTSVHCASADLAEEDNGEYFAKSRRKKTAPAGRDDELAERLWAISEELVGLRAPAAL